MKQQIHWTLLCHCFFSVSVSSVPLFVTYIVCVMAHVTHIHRSLLNRNADEVRPQQGPDCHRGFLSAAGVLHWHILVSFFFLCESRLPEWHKINLSFAHKAREHADIYITAVSLERSRSSYSLNCCTTLQLIPVFLSCQPSESTKKVLLYDLVLKHVFCLLWYKHTRQEPCVQANMNGSDFWSQ